MEHGPSTFFSKPRRVLFGLWSYSYNCKSFTKVSSKDSGVFWARGRLALQPFSSALAPPCPSPLPSSSALVHQATERYVVLAEKYGLTPTELAVAWAPRSPRATVFR